MAKQDQMNSGTGVLDLVLDVTDFTLDRYGRFEIDNVEWLEEIAGGSINGGCGNSGCGNGGCACIS